ncbi:DUF1131 family protein [Chthonobacter albigriseus]|uniref:DUF1131 family protein n=1 Tax=Chthonobacter albigriseus TaxID=1683161 RepID=UPI0015EF108D|nr:DUF1131 family protein [Chthonobacter albigriseus]
MITKRLCLSAVLVASLGGCSSGIDSDFGSATATTQSVDILAITAGGVSGLPQGTPFSEAAIEEALPGFDASAITMATETDTQAAIALFRDGLQVVQVLPGPDGAIGSVHGVSTQLRGPAGERIGMSFAEAQVDPSACRLGSGNWFGMPICTSPVAPNVSLVFSTSGFSASPTDAMRNATLERIIWTPGFNPAAS